MVNSDSAHETKEYISVCKLLGKRECETDHKMDQHGCV